MSFLKKLKNDISETESTEEEIDISDNAKKEKTTGLDRKQQREEKKEIKLKQKSEKTTDDWLGAEGQLAVDVFDAGSEFCIQAPIAGVSVEELDISVENEMLTIKGERKKSEINKDKNYFYQECYWGPFSRQIILPDDADSNKIRASLQKGILTIRVPRAIIIKKKKISVISGD